MPLQTYLMSLLEMSHPRSNHSYRLRAWRAWHRRCRRVRCRRCGGFLWRIRTKGVASGAGRRGRNSCARFAPPGSIHNTTVLREGHCKISCHTRNMYRHVISMYLHSQPQDSGAMGYGTTSSYVNIAGMSITIAGGPFVPVEFQRGIKNRLTFAVLVKLQSCRAPNIQRNDSATL